MMAAAPDLAARAALIDQLEQFPHQLRAVVAPLSEAQRTTPYLSGEWTVAQNVHHLVDSHANSIIRMKLILTEEHPTVRPYDQDRWALLPDSTGVDIENSLHLLAGMHHRWALLLRSLSESDWQRTGMHPDAGVISLTGMLESYVQHGLEHIAQIQRILAAAPSQA